MGLDPQTVVIDSKPTRAILRIYVGEYRYADETLRVTLDDGKSCFSKSNGSHELRPRSDVNFYAMGWDRKYTFRPWLALQAKY